MDPENTSVSEAAEQLEQEATDSALAAETAAAAAAAAVDSAEILTAQLERDAAERIAGFEGTLAQHSEGLEWTRQNITEIRENNEILLREIQASQAALSEQSQRLSGLAESLAALTQARASSSPSEEGIPTDATASDASNVAPAPPAENQKPKKHRMI